MPEEELCPRCQGVKADLESIKDGKRCAFACPMENDEFYSWSGGCAMKAVAKCGHKTNTPKHGKCIGADSCLDYEPERPWWKLW